MKKEIKNFVKAKVRELILLLLLVAIGLKVSLPPNFYLLELPLIPIRVLISLINSFFYGIIKEVTTSALVRSFSYAISSGILLTLGYWFSSFIIKIWDRLLNLFSKEVTRIIKIILLLLGIGGIILLAPSSYFVETEESTYSEVKLDSDSKINFFWETLQEINLRNDYFLTTGYKLPEVTVCAQDIQTGKAVGYSVEYSDGSQPIKEQDFFGRSVVQLGPGESITVYLKGVRLTEFSQGSNNYHYHLNKKIKGKAIKEEFKKEIDRLLLFPGVGFNNYSYCSNLTEKDIAKAEKIKIVR